MAFARWDPFHDLLTLQEQIDCLSGDASGWAPPVDVFETSDRYELIVEVPGLTRDCVRIHVHEGTLTVDGERPAPSGSSRELYHRVERGHGRFSRMFRLREPIDAGAVTANLRDGVLTITVPKAPPESRPITVR